jgi:pimeloyl-ACP methyl ester carboxylesterase
MAIADLGGRRAFYVREGAGEPLLMIMGMAGHHLTWGAELPALLSTRYDLIRYDHRGIGDSDPAQAPFSVADLADDAARLLDALAVPTAHVFGISLGGAVAQEVALRHPHRVRTLTLGCTYAGGPAADLGAPGRERLLAAMATGDARVSVRTAFEVNLSREYAQDPRHFEVFAETAIAVRVPVPVVALQALAAAGHDTSGRLPTLSVPTLVMHGSADEMIFASNGRHVASLIPGATLESFDGAGHLFWWEDPKRAAALIEDHARS